MKILYLHPWPLSPERKAALVAAKQTLGLLEPIKPEPAEPLTRVLAWETPSVLCDYAPVRDTTTKENLAQALSWALGLTEDDRPVTLDKFLSRLVGAQVREVVE